jgi:glycosyltransferase involved in cell wall biosynthesis
MPLVSVLTPVYNGERYLAECIESVLAQSFVDWEYIILDNSSTDRTGTIAKHYGSLDTRIKVFRNDHLLPMIANFNRAATLVAPETKYLHFLCADDLLFPDCLSRMVEVAEADPSVVLVGSYKICGDRPVCDGPPFPHRVMNGRDVCREFFQGRLDLLGSQTNHLIRKQDRQRELFDVSFVHADTELWVRLLKDGACLGFVHQVLTFSRIHGEAASERAHVLGSGDIETLAILMKHGAAFLSGREHREMLREKRNQLIRARVRSFAKAWDRRPWEYQAQRSREFGIRFGLLETVKAGLLEATAGALSPLETARRVRWSYRRGRNAK